MKMTTCIFCNKYIYLVVDIFEGLRKSNVGIACFDCDMKEIKKSDEKKLSIEKVICDCGKQFDNKFYL